ncbi:uncharacterized protein LACBIDRAFT_296580 [Laccaria bicolor S238N-H82]|uniref:Predicted protein n=1 Tax=Laccaria bicolor (strain S238N-H82 / ATCC MYA-4686) TaxID=486041 RepID=B0D962_LACBS|nr:uncharacterized protein LACBIDRAFT_296580 [Laccaria bicolor S238N-H82]EDR09198.1 predicted protein [Laccaria bicolor S238N-H82]|eukprot:XP_001880511.1 predicted protein [Laccaria bicolor S238N-H82]
MAQPPQLHRRKSSRDEEENVVIVPHNGIETPAIMAPPPPRNRVHSTPHDIPPSLGQFRMPPRLPMNGTASPLRSSFSMTNPPPHLNGSHARTRSISTPFSRPLASPLLTSFPSTPILSSPTSPRPSIMITSHSAPDTSADTAAKHSRRHSRMHSRNLSVFFPRPGSLPASSISEDGGQELEIHHSGPIDEEAPAIIMPSASPPTPLGKGFTFGARPPNSALPSPMSKTPGSGSSSASRRGHHHKHSLSHNFFSFLEPGGENLHTEPAPIPVSPWTPMPDSAGTSSSSPSPTEQSRQVPVQDDRIPVGAAAASIAQFVLGAYLWVCGQQIGSLSCTGLGYWVVFDSFGVAFSEVVPPWLASGYNGVRDRLRRPYGNGRLETVLMFAHVVYLMFSSVYVCKETVEHLLLSAGGVQGHHHHHGDEEAVSGLGIDFPVFATLITFLSLVATALIFNNHTKLVNVTGNRIPSLPAIVRLISSFSKHTRHEPPPTTPLTLMLSNPYVTCPLAFCASIFFIGLLLPPTQHRIADLVLALIIAMLTFKVAYRASVVLGTVLLQTSPPRGMASGKMEAFLRAMREVERHPQVLHLPAPHIWQLTPSPQDFVPGKGRGEGEALVVTLELHVTGNLGDDDVLKLTKWARERCVGALGREEAEVTVGIVRG